MGFANDIGIGSDMGPVRDLCWTIWAPWGLPLWGPEGLCKLIWPGSHMDLDTFPIWDEYVGPMWGLYN